MARNAGLLACVPPHDLRRGALRDVTYLRDSISRGFASRGSALFAGHGPSSLENGVTQQYVGILVDAILNKRVRDNFKDTLAPRIARPMAKKIFTMLEIEQFQG